MAPFKCPGCPARFDNNRGYSNHKRKCKSKINAAAAGRLELRKKNVKKIQEERQQSASDLLPEVQEPEIEMVADPVVILFLFLQRGFY
jgi:hypothetical protein